MEQQQTKYTTILHNVRETLDLSLLEYCVADTIYKLSSNPKAPILGWCNASKDTMAKFIGVDRRTIIRIINNLVAKKIVERNDKDPSNTRTTEVWYDNAIIGKTKIKRTQGVTKCHGGGDILSHNNSIYNNNNDLTIGRPKKRPRNPFERIQNKYNNPNKKLTRPFQEQAVRFAKELKIDLREAETQEKGIRSKWFKCFKNGGKVNVAYTKCIDAKGFVAANSLGKIYYFFKVLQL